MLNILNRTKNSWLPAFRNLINVRAQSTEATADAAKPNTTSVPPTETAAAPLAPLILPQQFGPYEPLNKRICRHVWVESLSTPAQRKEGLIELHPDIFAAQPRVDVIQENIEWQQKYRYVSFAHTKTRAEVRGGGRKPWPQKGGGRARHGSIRSPLFKGGGVAHGPRSPTTHFYMLDFYKRIMGLTATLSVKLAQNDLHVIRDVEMPTNEPSFLKELIKARKWGPAVLIVDKEDIFPENICMATDRLGYVNIMPAYGLNTYSMLKHDTLVLTVAAVQHIEQKLLFHLNRTDAAAKLQKFKLDQ